jgi:signal transduction histidine kinase
MSDELAKLDQMKDDFMSHVTHELRSPLTSIIATVELMGEMPQATSDPKLKRSIDRLMFGSERLNKLVDNILDLMKMEAGQIPFDIQPTNIGSILKEMADFFEPRAQEKNLVIKADVPSKLPLAMADSERIRQVISNLIHNAVKFTNRSGITLLARESSGELRVEVKDTGVGIPADKLGSVFKKFECLKDTKDRVEKPVPGSGLGLNIVQNSIKAQKGRIWVESVVDQGTSFVFTLPLAPSEKQQISVVSGSGKPVAHSIVATKFTPRTAPIMVNRINKGV